MAHLTEEERGVGVVACSAGNHAQGVALAASKMNLKATIVMPSGYAALMEGGLIKTLLTTTSNTLYLEHPQSNGKTCRD